MTSLKHTMFVNALVVNMIEYQAKNNITSQCLSNAQYLYDCLKGSKIGKAVRVKPVMVVSPETVKDGKTIWNIVSSHMVVILTTETDSELVIECSHDVALLKERSYYDNVKDLLSNFDESFSRKSLSEWINIKAFLTFIKYADEINRGEFVIADRDNYLAQADYIEKKMKNISAGYVQEKM